MQALMQAFMQALMQWFWETAKTGVSHDWDAINVLKVLEGVSVMSDHYFNPDLSLDVENLFLGLAWLGEATTMQIHRLWRPHSSLKYTRKLLVELKQHRWIKSRVWTIPRRADGIPIRIANAWSLTRRAELWLRDHVQWPLKYIRPRHPRTMTHDLMTSELVTRIIELGREAGLGNLYLEREVRLDQQRRRPIMDGFVMLRLGNAYGQDRRVPWTNDPRAPGEQRRRYAIENDRNSEPFNVIYMKAISYQMTGTPQWFERYGGLFPLVLWLVPHEPRAELVMRAWQEAWPGGKWLITTDERLQQDRWTEYHAGVIRERGLFRTPRRSAEEEGRS